MRQQRLIEYFETDADKRRVAPKLTWACRVVQLLADAEQRCHLAVAQEAQHLQLRAHASCQSAKGAGRLTRCIDEAHTDEQGLCRRKHAARGCKARTSTSSGRSSRPGCAPAGSARALARAAARCACAPWLFSGHVRRSCGWSRAALWGLLLERTCEGQRRNKGSCKGRVADTESQARAIKVYRACSVCVSTRRRRLSSSTASVRHENGAQPGPARSASHAGMPAAAQAA